MTSEKVEIPALTLDGQNWKIYHTKLIEAAATHIVKPLGVLAGWEEYDGTNDWEGQDATAKFLIYPTLPLELLRPIQKLNTAHEMFVFLTQRFHDTNPIERDAETKAKTCANDEVSNGQSGSTNEHATEVCQTVERAGIATEDSESPQRSGDESVMNRDENTTYQVETMLKWPKPFVGTCYRCKEVGHRVHNCRKSMDLPGNSANKTRKPKTITDVDGKAMLGRDLAGMVHRVNEGKESDADTYRTALLGKEPVEMACGVNEGDGTECKGKSQLQTEFYCEENHQYNENAKNNIPNAHGLPLVGEWIGCASGEAGDSLLELESHERDMVEPACVDEAEVDTQTPSECCQQLVSMDGNTGRKAEMLVTMSIELENPGGGDILCMYLGSMNWCAGDPNGLGTQTDGSGYQADGSRDLTDGSGAQTDTLNVLNGAETVGISHGDKESTYLGAGGTKHNAEVTDGFGSHTDTSSTWTGVLSARTDVDTTVNEPETFSMPPIESKWPKLPTRGESSHADTADRSRNHLSMLSTHTDAYTIGNEMETTENKVEIVSMRLMEPKLPDPLTMGANACANKPNSCGNPVEMLTGHREAPSIKTDGETTANTIKTVRILQIEPKTQNSPIGTAKQCPDEPDSQGTKQMHQVDAWTCTALETMCKWL